MMCKQRLMGTEHMLLLDIMLLKSRQTRVLSYNILMQCSRLLL